MRISHLRELMRTPPFFFSFFFWFWGFTLSLTSIFGKNGLTAAGPRRPIRQLTHLPSNFGIDSGHLVFTFHLWEKRLTAAGPRRPIRQLTSLPPTSGSHTPPTLTPSPYISLWDSARSPHPTVKSRFLSKESWGQVYTFPLVSRRCSLTPPLPLPPPLSLSLSLSRSLLPGVPPPIEKINEEKSI